jgi:hypothetical protein
MRKLTLILRTIFRLKKKDDKAACIHNSNLEEMRKATEALHELNRELVKRSVAYKVYMAAGKPRI